MTKTLYRLRRRHLGVSASVVALLVATPFAASYAADAATPAAELDEVVVTGSRIVRDGYDAPTPVTVVGIEQLQDAAKPNIADALNQMPAFQGSTTPASSGTGNGGTSGGNNLNLRNFGPQRTLVLFDGRRVPPSSANSVVDTNLLPDGLISRVDVVTGGASAVYGSDALAGVVNFVIDTEFEGVKGLIQGGVTSRGDGQQYKTSLATGTSFAGGRGHFVIEGSVDHQDRIDGTERQWNMDGWYHIQNPQRTATNGLPLLLLTDRVGLSSGYPGGTLTRGVLANGQIVANSPLKGISFGPNGTPFNYNYGDFVSGTYNVGGDWAKSTEAGAASIMIGSNSTHLFSNLKYEITDDFEVFAQFNTGGVKTDARCCWVYHFDNLLVSMDNPYIPSNIVAQARALGYTAMYMGKTIRDDPHGFGMYNDRIAFNYTVGAKGRFDAFETDWHWDAYAQRGITKQSFWVPYQSDKDKFALAIDAVTGPNGAPACRVNVDADPTNNVPNCVPYNLFGTNVVSQEAFDWTMDGPRLYQTIGQNVGGASVTGEPFQIFDAGPVAIALSGEYRKDSIRGQNDPVSDHFGWFSTQMTGFNAKQTVVEGALEVDVPVLADMPWAQALNINAAFRATDYSAVGFVSTWKVGATYSPIDEVRIRLTQSRDIRAPNLQDLYSPPQANHNTIPDPFRGNQSTPYDTITQGNNGLQPEKANTTGIGVVYQPEWLSGFNASVDYYRINAKGAIASPSFDYVITQCFAGVQAYCNQVARFPVPAGQPAGTIGILKSITTGPQNQARQDAKGLDLEVSYRTNLSNFVDSWNGNLGIRIIANHAISRITDSGIAGPTQILDAAGFNDVPKWNVNTQISYSLDKFRFTYINRWLSKGQFSNTLIECQSGCPTISGFRTVNRNWTPSYSLSSATLTYRFFEGEGDSNAEGFFNVDNIFDKNPPVAPQQIAGATYALTTNASMYDTLGRRYRVGIRFRM